MSTKKNIEMIYPLSPIQEGILFHTLYKRDSDEYFEQLCFTLCGHLDTAAFGGAWQGVVDRHPMLRTAFISKRDGRALQVVRRQVNVHLGLEDWRHLSAEEQGERWWSWLEEDRRRGFDLKAPPLLRLQLFRIDAEVHRFAWSFQHLLLDGWSLSHVLKEVFALYDGLRCGETPNLPPARPYHDYVRWLKKQDLGRAEDFWRRTFEGYPGARPLVVDRGGAGAEGEAMGEPQILRSSLSVERTEALGEFARRHRLTLNTVVQGAWALLLQRYSGADDLVFGATVSGRPTDLPGAESIVGPLINTLPVRAQIRQGEELVPWLLRLQGEHAESRQFEYSPLVNIQEWSEIPPGQSLFDTTVVFENYPLEVSLESWGADLKIREFHYVERQASALTLLVIPGQEIALWILFDTARFEGEVMERLLGHLSTLLGEIAGAEAKTRLSEIDLLSAEERKRLLAVASGADLLSNPEPFPQVMDHWASQQPEAPALLGETSMTYGDLRRDAARIATALGARGVGPGCLVVLAVRTLGERMAGLLGILQRGAAWVLLDPTEPRRRQREFLGRCPDAFLVTEESWTDHLGIDAERTLLLDSESCDSESCGEAEGDGGIEGRPALGDAAYALAGPSVNPVFSRAGLWTHLERLQAAQALGPKDVVLQGVVAEPGCIVREVLWPLAQGARLVDGGAGHETWVESIVRHAVTVAFLPTEGVRTLVEAAEAGALREASLRMVILSGDAPDASLVQRFFQLAPEATLARCWSLEETGAVALETYSPGEPSGDSPLVPLTGCALYVLDGAVLDGAGRPQPVGLFGALHVAGDDLGSGFLNEPAATAEHWTPDPYAAVPGQRRVASGDRGRVLGDGRVAEVGPMGRRLRILGRRIDPREIETVLLAHPSVAEAVVLGRRTVDGVLPVDGVTRLVAYVVPSGVLDAERLRKDMDAELPEALRLHLYVRLEQMPLTSHGGVDTAALEGLPILDEDLASHCTERLAEMPGVAEAAALVREVEVRTPALHRSDLVADWGIRSGGRGSGETGSGETGSGETGSGTTESKEFAAPSSQSTSELPNGRPSVSEGEPLRRAKDEPATLGEALVRAARGAVDAVDSVDAGVLYIEDDGSESFQSYGDVLADAEGMLSGLRGLGLVPGDPVMFQLEQNAQFVTAFWACTLGGFVPVPVTIPPTWEPSHSGVEKLVNAWRMLDGPPVLAGDALAANLATLADGALRVVTPSDLSDSRPEESDQTVKVEHHRSDPDAPALMLLTSGSTGLPKAVVQSHRAILYRCAATAQENQFTPRDVSLNWFPLDHVGGLVMFHIRDIYVGARQLLAPTETVLRSPLVWLDWIDRHRVTATWAPNFAFGLINDRAAEVADRTWDLSCLRFILNAGEAIVARTTRRFLTLLAPHGLPATAMFPAWGMSETCSAVTFSELFTVDSTSDGDLFVEVGHPVPGFAIRVVDGDDRPVPEGEIGQLQVRGPSVTSGYYANPDLNAEVFTADGWFNTGDLGRLRSGCLTITGRQKDILIVHGVNYYCHEVEAVVEEVDQVQVSFTAVCAVRSPGSDTDQVVVFFSPATEASGDRELADLLGRIRQAVVGKTGLFPQFIVPVEAEEIPKTAIGKIQRSKLVEGFQAGEFDAHLKRADLVQENARTLPSWFFRRIWRPKKVLVQTPGSFQGTELIFADASGLDESGLAERWLTRPADSGSTRILVERGTTFERLGEGLYRLDPSAGGHRLLLEDLAQRNLRIDRVVDLRGYAPPREIDSPTALRRAQEEGFFQILDLVRTLAEVHGLDHPLSLYVVTRRSLAVLDGEEVAYGRSTLPGLLRSLPQEWPELGCRQIDFGGERPERDAARLAAELRVSGGEAEVAYRGGRRLVPRLERIAWQHVEPAAVPLEDGATLLVTGGLGGLGFELSRTLLERFQARLLLVGRTPLPKRRERLEALESLALRCGGEVMYRAADVADGDALRSAVGAAETHWRSELEGIFHLAGELDLAAHWDEMEDHLAVAEGAENFERLFRSKVYGTWNLGQLLEDRPEALWVAFSSVNSLFGGSTFSAYSAANRFLDGYSAHLARERPRARVHWLNWTMWDDLGMSAGNPRYATEAGRAMGYRVIPVDQGLDSLFVALAHGPGQHVVGLDGDNVHVRGQSEGQWRPRRELAAWFTSDSSIPATAETVTAQKLDLMDRFGTPVPVKPRQVAELPKTAHGEVDLDALLALHRQDSEGSGGGGETPRDERERRMATLWQEVLGVQRVGIHDNFFELGGDSIVSLQLVARAGQVGWSLTPQLVFQNPTVAELAAAAKDADGEGDREQGLVVGEVPLTPIQSWFFAQPLAHPERADMSVLLELRRPLEVRFLEAALGRLLAHHDALRLRFRKTDVGRRRSDGWQQWHADVDPKISLVSREGAGESVAEVAERLRREFHLAEGPLLRAALFDGAENHAGRLLLVAHHLVVDGVSWRVLLEDLEAAYGALALGQEPRLPPKTTSYRRWANLLRERAESTEARAEAEFWLGQSASSGRLPEVPLDHPEGRNLGSSVDVVKVSLDSEATQRVFAEGLKAWRARIDDLLLTALAQAVGEVTGRRDLVVELESHGREDLFEGVDLSRTVGWFTTLYPVRLALAETAGSRDALREVKERLRSLPHQGIGYGVLRELCDDPALRQRFDATATPQISFNYLGRFDALHGNSELFSRFGLHLLEEEVEEGPDTERPHQIEIGGWVTEGRLEFEWRYSRNLHRPGTIEGLAQRFIAALRAFIEVGDEPAEAALTPMDFPLAGLDHQELDKLTGLLANLEEAD